ncbi:DNA helicase RecQ [bacterium]|nr:DNA helicase RecQ [bacterium]
MQRTALHILNRTYGYPAFRGHQAAVIDHLTSGGDALLLMPTGGGKSLCYQIPALLREGAGVVISPLIALMQDQVGAVRQLGLRAAFLNSTLEPREAARVEGDLLRGELDLLYVAPERLLQPRTLELLDKATIALFAIDEAHCVSQWGHDFRPEYLQLAVLHERYPAVPRLACTATADERTRAEILANLKLEDGRTFIGGFDRPNIRYRVVAKDDPRRQLLKFLREEHPGDAGIVYCLARKKTEETAEFLQQHGFAAAPYHAGLDAGTRRLHQERFLNEDGLIVCATIAFGMKIDKPDVRFVAHLDLPKSIEGYYQETGRAGRDGLPADAWLCYGLQDVVMLRKLIDAPPPDGVEVDELYRRRSAQQLDTMLGYCEVTACRRQRLLAHFGEVMPRPCGNCDTCLWPPETFDATVVAQKALSCVARTGQRFGAQHVIEVLRGGAAERVLRLGHDRLSTYGIGGELDAFGWRSVMRQLVAGGYLALDPDGYGGLRLTAAAGAVLRGEQQLHLRRDVLERAAGKGAARKARRAATALAADVDDTFEPDAATVALFDRLRALRKRLASEAGVPPYVIFHDRTLAEMARRRPTSEAALLGISGVGQAKLERYGEAFLGEIRGEEG